MATSERCPTCDRAECRAGERTPPELHPVIQRILDRRATAEDIALFEADLAERVRFSDECRAHRVSWRERCLTAEAERDRAREALDAASALAGQWCEQGYGLRGDKLTAEVAKIEAIRESGGLPARDVADVVRAIKVESRRRWQEANDRYDEIQARRRTETSGGDCGA